MRKILTILFLCALFVPAQAKVGLEVKAGLGVSTYQGDEFAGNHFSGKIGLGVDIPLAGRWSIEPSLYYAGKGTQFSGLYVTENYDKETDVLIARFRNSLHYLEIPILAVYKIPFDEKTYLSIKAGPYFGIGLKGTANVKTPMYNDFDTNFSDDLFSDGCEYNQSAYTDMESALAGIFLDEGGIYTKAFRRIDAGITANVSLTYRHFVVGFECAIGMVHLSDYFLSGKPRNLSTCVMFGYKF